MNRNEKHNNISLISKLLACLAVFIACFKLDSILDEHELGLVAMFALLLGLFVGTYFICYGIGSFCSIVFGKPEEETAEQAGADIKNGDIYYFYGDYHFGYSRVEQLNILDAAHKQVKSKFAFANEEGEIITKWYDGATEFEEPGVAVIYEDGRYNVLDSECNPILLSWPSGIGEQISDGKLKVFWDDGTINFVDCKNKTLLWKDWKKSIG